ncbi:hypothetical protein L9F63_013106 [Diploptera punctata]|uniref:acylglycerol lipase n=1 Tax=Diploptera punctata TaxID=6984 RepID=A0AAD8EMH3_DIPPU|nr:hypothetical protein L9F63_013106 [Diploptera punctata]
MNCQADVQSWLESVQNFMSRAVRPCITWIPCLQRWRQVHPATSTSNTHVGDKFIHLGSHRRIRVIHIESNKHKVNSWYVVGKDDDLENMGYKSEGLNVSNKRKSLSLLSNYSELSSEEYWFTRWNKPLKAADPCNCSFRKSWRNSMGDSQILVNQPKVISDVNQDLHYEQFSQNISSKVQNRYLLIETFAERMLEGIWNEVFNCFSESESKKPNYIISTSDTKDFYNKLFDDAELTYKNVEFESSINYENLEDFNCKTLISCQESENGVQIKEINDLNEEENKDKTFQSVGCVNPSFLGSKGDPDLLEYAVTYDGSPMNEECSPYRDFANCDMIENMKYEDTDSGFNTASLESTNHHASEIDCTASRKDEALNETENNCFDVSEHEEIMLNNSLSDVSVNTVINDKTLETKDILQHNQISLTSIDIRLVDMHTSAESEFMSKKLNQQGRSKQCCHAKQIRRLKPLLYFLHGVGCSADLWSSLLEHFSRAGYEVMAPDMLGHGYSTAPDNPAAYTFHCLLKDAIDIFDRFVGEHRKCVVIGHAYGSKIISNLFQNYLFVYLYILFSFRCSLAAALGRYRPQQVSHLVLISGGGPAPLAPHTENGPPTVSPCLQAFLKPLLLCGFRRNILYAPCGKHIESCPSMSKGIPHYVIRYVYEGQDWPEGDATFHRRILAPTLLVHGLKDPYVTLVQECEMERTIPRSFLELIPDAGHYSMLETPKRLSHMIHCFIDWWSR